MPDTTAPVLDPLRDPGTTWVVVDVMNVVGSRPDGWWRDRTGACARLVDDLAAWAASSDRAVTAVVDGEPTDRLSDGTRGGVEVVLAGRARDAADDRIVELVHERGAAGALVVTADRGLRERVHDLAARTIGPATFRAHLEAEARPRPFATRRTT